MPLTKNYRNEEDYQIASSSTSSIYMGSHQTAFYKLRFNDVQERGRDSKYYNRLLCPEARGERWTLNHNAAFWAGGIDAKRMFALVTPITSYFETKKNRETGLISGTQIELFWLHSNGYRFEQKPENPEIIWCVPPAELPPEDKRILRTNVSKNEGLAVIQEIFNSLHPERNKRSRSEAPNSDYKNHSVVKKTRVDQEQVAKTAERPQSVSSAPQQSRGGFFDVKNNSTSGDMIPRPDPRSATPRPVLSVLPRL